MAGGGPNAHSLSIVTLVTALILEGAGGAAALPILHVLHFAVAAVAMAGLYRLLTPIVGTVMALATSLAALSIPIVLTQAGYLYLEMPLLATTVWAIVYWRDGRRLPAGLLAAVATSIKLPGLAVAITLASYALLDRANRTRFRVAAAVMAAPMALAVADYLVTTATWRGETLAPALRFMMTFLLYTPDVLVLLLVFPAAMILTRSGRRSRAGRELPEVEETTLQLIGVLLVVFLAFHLAATMRGYTALPRYYTQVVPLLLAGLVIISKRRIGVGATVVMLITVLVLSIVNYRGDLYPRNDVPAFALIERSAAYLDLSAVQQRAAAALARLPGTEPVFLAGPMHYMTRYPEMGYVKETFERGQHIGLYDLGSDLSGYPPSFYLHYESSALGGDQIKDLWEQAERDSRRRVEVSTLTAGRFRNYIIHVMATAGG